MVDVVLDLKNLPVPTPVLRAKAIPAGIAATPVFSTLSAKLMLLDGNISSLETLLTAQATTKATYRNAISTREAGETVLLKALAALGSDVGSLTTLKSQVIAAQMRVKDQAAPKAIPNQPTAWNAPPAIKKARSPGSATASRASWTTTKSNAPAPTPTPPALSGNS